VGKAAGLAILAADQMAASRVQWVWVGLPRTA